MKANKAPEKLYIALNEFTEDGRTFVLDHRTDYPICTEYIRSDAFIERAEAWLRRNQQGFILTDKDITDFINNMKGE